MVVGTSRPFTFDVHQSIICDTSRFFRQKIRSSRDRVVLLPTEEPEIFEIYLHWLYFSTFFDDAKVLSVAQAASEHLRLARAFALGTRMEDTQFQDAVMDAITEQSRIKHSDGSQSCPGTTAIEHIYSHSSIGSNARSCLVYIFASVKQWNPAPTWEKFPPVFVADLMAELYRRKPNSRGTMPPCAFHKHAPGGKCYKSGRKRKHIVEDLAKDEGELTDV